MRVSVPGAIERHPLILGLLVAACGPGPGAEPVPAPAPVCEVVGDGTADRRRLDFALVHAVEPAHAPVPRTFAEARLFPLLYSTLVHFDCEGRPRAGLAGEWASKEGGRTWILQLDPEARFWDGSPVTASDVAISVLAVGEPDEMRIPGIAGIGVLDERTLSIRFERRYRDVPRMLGAPELAVALRREVAGWPLGAGAYRPDDSPDDVRAVGEEMRIEAIPTGGSRPTLSFRVVPGADGRDLIDKGADLLVTVDEAVLEYVHLRPDLITAPLPWDRTYVLLAPTRVRAASLASTWNNGLPPDLLEELARHAVSGGARPYGGSGWWEGTERLCRETRARLGAHPPPPPTAAYRTSGARRVVYREGDATAAELAGRLVALAAARVEGANFEAELAAAIPGLDDGRGTPNAVALPDSVFESQLQVGGAFLFVLPLPLNVFDTCHALEQLGGRAPWLALGTLEPTAAIVPLVDTRPYLVAREGIPRIYVDWGGALRFESSPAAASDR